MGTARVIREEAVLLPSYRDNGALIWRAWCPAYGARYKPWPHRSRTWYPSSLTTACALITLGVLSSRAVEALRPRISRTRSIAVQATALEEMHSRNKQDDSDCGRTARQMEDIMAWRDDKARATLIRDAAGSVQPGKTPRTFAELLFGYTNVEDLTNCDASSLAFLAEQAWEHVQQRTAGSADIRVVNPMMPDGREISVLEVLNDNMPFLFDSRCRSITISIHDAALRG